jgi:hypothetical protein
MRRFHPLRAVRSTGWRWRAAAGLAAGGLLAGTLFAPPAGAHGTGPHLVFISGWVDMTVAAGAQPCEQTYAQVQTLQASGPTSVRFDIKQKCGGMYFAIVMTANLRDDKYVDIDGFARFKYTSCLLGDKICWPETAGSRDFRASVPEDFVQRMQPVQLGTHHPLATFAFDVIIDGPDAPAMSGS